MTTTVWIIETAVSKNTWNMQIMPILRLIEPVARSSISCHLFYQFYNDWAIDCLKMTDPAGNEDR